MMYVMVTYSHDVLGEVLENRITNYLMAYFRKKTLVFLPYCDNIPIAWNKMRSTVVKSTIFIVSLDLDPVLGHVLKQVD